jgi:hypothetical protein
MGRKSKELDRKKLLPFSQNFFHHINRSSKGIHVYFNKLWDTQRICHFDVGAHERRIIILAMYNVGYT